MVLNLPDEEYFAKGHRACAGCGCSLVMRHVLKAAGKDVIVCQATGCMEVVSTPYPETAWRIPWIHVTFENAASVASGVYRALKYQGKKTNVLVIGGDGGTFDIGFQALSGAAERGEDICYVCYDNEAYMNTGIQRSGATPKFAATTTSPAGKKVHGKTENTKNMPFILAAHGAYVATANIAFVHDFVEKVRKGLAHKGPAYIQVFAPCTPGWKIDTSITIELCKTAFKANVTPLYEIIDGVVKISKKPSEVVPVSDYLKPQGRFKHMNPEEIQEMQEFVDKEWERISKLDETKIRII